MTHFQEIIERWKAPINTFWGRMLRFAQWLTGTAIAIVGLGELAPGIQIPAMLVTVCSYIIVGGTVLGVSAKLTKP